MPRRHRKMKGGFLDSFGSTLSNLGSTLSQSASSAWQKTKSAVSSTPSSSSSYSPSTTTSSTGSYMGGKRRTKRRHMRGGYEANSAITGLAANTSPISGIKSAQPHNLVGGKTRKRGRKSSKRRRH